MGFEWIWCVFSIAFHLVIEGGPTFLESFPALHLYSILFRTNQFSSTIRWIWIECMKRIVKLVPEQNSCVMCLFAHVCKIYRETKVYLISRGECPSHISFKDSGSRTVLTAQYAGTERPSPFYTSSLRCTERAITTQTKTTKEITGLLMIRAWTINWVLLPVILIARIQMSDTPAPGFGHAVGLLLPAKAQE